MKLWSSIIFNHKLFLYLCTADTPINPKLEEKAVSPTPSDTRVASALSNGRLIKCYDLWNLNNFGFEMRFKLFSKD